MNGDELIINLTSTTVFWKNVCTKGEMTTATVGNNHLNLSTYMNYNQDPTK